jgi:hypothetical protein
MNHVKVDLAKTMIEKGRYFFTSGSYFFDILINKKVDYLDLVEFMSISISD